MRGSAAHYTAGVLESKFPASKSGQLQSNKYYDERTRRPSLAGFLIVWDKMKAQPSPKKSLRDISSLTAEDLAGRFLRRGGLDLL